MVELLMDQVEFECGQVLLVSDGESLCALDFAGYEARTLRLLKKRYGTVQFKPAKNFLGVGDRLQSYLCGNLTALDAIPVNPGGTPFQNQVWLTLRTIPPGTVVTYSELARRIGKPTACRAVGMTNGLNPIAIVLPCHRVIGSNGQLTGYAGGLDTKRWLLRHEGVGVAEPC